MIKRHIIIPARLESSRLPKKLLLDLAGKSVLQHVYERAIQCNFKQTIIATDSNEIKKVAESFGANVCMTHSDHKSGTDRLAEAVEKLKIDDEDIVVNLQGDEPLIHVQNIIQTANLLTHKHQAVMATLCDKITKVNEINNPNCVKVVFNREQYALYFSRAPIPWPQGGFDKDNLKQRTHHYRHIGLYAYRAGFLKAYAKMEHSPLEQIESLEQLRILWHNYKIAITKAKHSTHSGIDTQEDLDKVRNLLCANF